MPKFKFKRNYRREENNVKSQADNKRGRLVVRNLPFSTTENTLTEHFSPYGVIEEVRLLKKPDGKLVGCGFVQFLTKQSAAKAIHHLSGKPFLSRKIIVDYALPKKKFESKNPTRKREGNTFEMKSNVDQNDSADKICGEGFSDNDEDQKSFVSNGSDLPPEGYSSGQEEHSDVPEKPKPSHDINEGKTIFFKNIPFSASNEDLKGIIEKSVGPVHYAVICIDPLTEHSKGTAFAKFRTVAHARKALTQDIVLKGETLRAFEAVDQRRLQQENNNGSRGKKDNRNLYLAKEGLIVAGTKAAEGVSINDMKQRLELETWKNLKLRNLNMFVSRNRLLAQNLPLSYDDAALRALFKRYSPNRAKILEAKVMKDLKNVDTNGQPSSKGYGFVSFSCHEDALATLRALNNNPNVFTPAKRPIVAFSIENRKALLAREKRIIKSKLNNPLCPDSKKPNRNDKKISETLQRAERFPKCKNSNKNAAGFEGIESRQGDTRMRKMFKMRSQGEQHAKRVKEMKKMSNKNRRANEMRKEKGKGSSNINSKSSKRLKSVEEGNNKKFEEMVRGYKEKIMPSAINMKKWYDD